MCVQIEVGSLRRETGLDQGREVGNEQKGMHTQEDKYDTSASHTFHTTPSPVSYLFGECHASESLCSLASSTTNLPDIVSRAGDEGRGGGGRFFDSGERRETLTTVLAGHTCADHQHCEETIRE